MLLPSSRLIAFSRACDADATISALQGRRMFVVLGNAVVDESMAVETWPSPGQTVVVGAPRRDLGGKGVNQAVVLHRAGAPVRLVAAVGRDADGDWIAATLDREGLTDRHLLRVEGATDRSLIFVLRDGENAIASTADAARSIDAAQAADLAAGLGAGDVLVLQGNLTLEATRAALVRARAGGAQTLLNPSPLQPGFADLLGLVDLLVLNEGEARGLGRGGTPADAAAAFRAAGVRTAVLTLGDRGAVLADETGILHGPATPARVVDTTGAGDTFTGVLAAGLYGRGLPLPVAAEAAGRAAALTVGRKGTLSAFPTAGEIAAIFAAQAR